MTSECRHLNEITYKKIENVLEGSKTIGTAEKVSQEPYFKSLYSSGYNYLLRCCQVHYWTLQKLKNDNALLNQAKLNMAVAQKAIKTTLINDWFERRTNQEEEKISSEPLITEHMDKFRQLCVSHFPDRRDYFNKIFDSYGYGQELLLDHLGFSYYGNYVSTYDLCYNHLTKGICGPYPRRYYKGKYKPSTDLSLIYGNLTQWGLKEQVYNKVNSHAKAQIEESEEIISENRAEYVTHDLAEVKKLNDFASFKRKKVVY